MLKIKSEKSHWRPKKVEYDYKEAMSFFKKNNSDNLEKAKHYWLSFKDYDSNAIITRMRRNTI